MSALTTDTKESAKAWSLSLGGKGLTINVAVAAVAGFLATGVSRFNEPKPLTTEQIQVAVAAQFEKFSNEWDGKFAGMREEMSAVRAIAQQARSDSQFIRDGIALDVAKVQSTVGEMAKQVAVLYDRSERAKEGKQ